MGCYWAKFTNMYEENLQSWTGHSPVLFQLSSATVTGCRNQNLEQFTTKGQEKKGILPKQTMHVSFIY
jgi:hypothetical protein